MKIVQPYADLVDHDEDGNECEFSLRQGIRQLRIIESKARISHRSEDKKTPDSWRRFLSSVILDHGDWSVVEHGVACVHVVHDRGIQQEITRHRHPSPTIESTRFVNYGKPGSEPAFVYPVKSFDDLPESPDEDWARAIQACEEAYQVLLRKGWPPQRARSVFPLCLASLMAFTANLRTWRHILLMRVTAQAHPSFRQVSIPLLKKFQKMVPLLFDDIVPMMQQKEAVKLPK